MKTGMTIHTTVYPPYWRSVSAAIVLFSRAAALVILVLLVFFETRLANPLRLIRVFTEASLVPGLVAWLLDVAFRATLELRGGICFVHARGRRMEIPCDSIDSIERWAFPI